MIPKAWRIFRKGLNTSTKGPVLFDSAAASDVMAEYSAHGADQMMDLEHLSLDRTKPNYDPNARAWYQLQVINGELWAINARFTPDGAQRLASKTQRYISPFFVIDPETRRVKRVINSALTALPASDKPMALVAASARPETGLLALSTLENNMDLLAILIQLLGLPPESTADDVTAAVKALQGGSSAVADSEPGEGGATAAPVTESVMPTPPASTGVGPKKTTVSIQHSESAAAVLELSQQVARLQADSLKDKRTALIKANASKLTPVLEAWAQTQSIDTLTSFFKAAPASEVVDEENAREATTQTKETAIALSQAELDVCRDHNVDPKAALAYKQKEAANRGSK